MKSERQKPAASPCLCGALRQASRAVSRLYDEELRGVGSVRPSTPCSSCSAGPAKSGSGTSPS